MSPECSFVVTIGQDADGIAKLVDAVGNTGIIEYFYSPSGPRLETRQVPLRELRRIELATQTRVFRLDPISGAWSVGRVDGGLVSGAALGKNEDHYHVRFPKPRSTLQSVAAPEHSSSPSPSSSDISTWQTGDISTWALQFD